MSDRVLDLALELESLFPAVLERLFLTPDDPLGHMPLVQLKIVRALAAGPSTSSALAARFHVSRPAVSQIIRRLVAAGMVVQRRDGEDGRVKSLELTPLAHHQLSKRSVARAQQATRVLATLPPAEVQRMMELLHRCASTDISVSLAS